MSVDISSLIEDKVVDGFTHQTSMKFKQTRETLVRVRLSYLRNECLMRLMRGVDNPDILKRLSLEDAGGYRDVLVPSDERTVPLSPCDRSKVINDIGHRAREECDRISSWLQVSSVGGSEGVASRLSEILKERAKDVEEKEKEIKELNDQIWKLSLDYYKLLHENSLILCNLIKEHQVKRILPETQSTVEYLTTKSSALCLKLKVVKLQLMAGTYTEEKVAALKEIKSYLDGMRQQMELQLVEARETLRHYNELGEEFVGLAKEYHHIREEIENKEWALNELKPHTDK